MQWIITVDHLEARMTQHGIPSSVGKMRGPKELVAELKTLAPEAKAARVEQFKATLNFEFRLYDDDGELYFTGLCLDLDQQDGDSAFQPLDWATADSGCTRMDYRKKGDKAWTIL